MAQIHGIAGEWARVQGTVRGLWPLLLAFFFLGVAVMLFFLVSVAFAGILLMAAVVAVCGGILSAFRHVERYFKGARGEERVAGILQTLPPQYHIFNDFVVGCRHIDHVVVGPAGVFAVETKFWQGVVTIEEGHILLDGQLPSRPPLRQVQREAALVKQALAKAGWVGAVTPVLAFAGDNFKAHLAEVQGAVVMNASDLKRSFETDRVILSPMELDRLVSLMENNS
jgi:hypothetical protein